jgi:tetratricopeptide (TPR) repeat protein
MVKNKLKIYLIVVLIFILGGLFIAFSFFKDDVIEKPGDNVDNNEDVKGGGINDAIDNEKEIGNSADINDIFNIEIPDDFDQYKIERLDNKIAETKQAFVEKPGDSWTWVMIGNMYEFVRDYERALVAYHKSLDITPNDITSTLNIATINEEQLLNYTEAEKYYSQAISIFPQTPDLYDRLALLYWRKMNRLEDAEVIYLQGLDQTKEHPDVILDLISFYDQTNQLDKKLIYVKKLLETYPDNELYKKDFGDLIQ